MNTPRDHIRRFHCHYRLPARLSTSRTQLDRVGAELRSVALPAALAGSSSWNHEIICVRKLVVPFQTTLRGSDAVIAAAWAHALREQLVRTIANGSGVVRYSSMSHALVDLTLMALRQDESRSWALKQLDLWPEQAPAGLSELPLPVMRVVAGLIRHAELVPALLNELARRDALAPLVAQLDSAVGVRAWVSIARATLQAFGVAGDVLDGPFDWLRLDSDSDSDSAADRVARRSPLIAAAKANAVPERPEVAAFWARSLAALALLQAEPDSLSRAFQARNSVANIASLLLRGAHSARTLAAREARSGSTIAKEALTRRASPATFEVGESDLGPADVRTTGSTRFAGLLFLWNVIGKLDWQGGELLPLPLEGRTLRWCLHRLALALVPMAERDATALAFCGLAPESEPPEDDAGPCTEDELAVLAAVARKLEAHVCQKLELAHEDNHLRALFQRQATIVADPGWIEVHLSLDDVSTPVRRAGLDLDPGFISCLGVVMGFRYG